MENVKHVLDPDGDILLRLTTTDEPFAPWDSQYDYKNAIDLTSTLLHNSSPGNVVLPPAKSTPVAVASSNSEPQAKRVKTETTKASPVEKAHVSFRLSSKHLTLASPYFAKQLGNNWRESIPKEDVVRLLKAEGWDEKAFLIVMGLVHCQNNFLPCTVELELLAKIAAIVDYYGCHAVMGHTAKYWATQITLKPGQTYDRDLIVYLFCSIVFQSTEDFAAATAILADLTRGRMQNLGLPIHDTIIYGIQRERLDRIRHLAAIILQIKKWLKSCPPGWDPKPSILQHGIFRDEIRLKHIHPKAILSSTNGYSVSDIVAVIKSIPDPRRFGTVQTNHDLRMIQSTIGMAMKDCWVTFPGLNLCSCFPQDKEDETKI